MNSVAPRASFPGSYARPSNSDAPPPQPTQPGSPSCFSPRLLVIGYGNTLRNDDGVGPRAAEAVASFNQPGVAALNYPLLTPELAHPISSAQSVVFVDAAIDGKGEVRLRPISAAASSRVLTHTVSPTILLALARDVFGHEPQAWLLTIPVVDLGFGETLSPRAQSGLDEALVLLRSLVCKR